MERRRRRRSGGGGREGRFYEAVKKSWCFEIAEGEAWRMGEEGTRGSNKEGKVFESKMERAEKEERVSSAHLRPLSFSESAPSSYLAFRFYRSISSPDTFLKTIGSFSVTDIPILLKTVPSELKFLQLLLRARLSCSSRPCSSHSSANRKNNASLEVEGRGFRALGYRSSSFR